MRRVFQILFVLGWVIGFGSWFPLAAIENDALVHPDHPTDQYTQPLNVKCVTRYVTPTEELIDEVAKRAFFMSLIVCAFGATGIEVSKRRERRKESTRRYAPSPALRDATDLQHH